MKIKLKESSAMIPLYKVCATKISLCVFAHENKNNTKSLLVRDVHLTVND